MRKPLATVKNPEGRLDILFYKVAERIAQLAEKRSGISGLAEKVMPIIDEEIRQNMKPRKVKFGPEVRLLVTLLQGKEVKCSPSSQ